MALSKSSTGFPDLPAELRIMIWEEAALSEPQFIFIPRMNKPPKRIGPAPNILRVCQESRREALKFYEGAFVRYENEWVGFRRCQSWMYCNFDLDIFIMELEVYHDRRKHRKYIWDDGFDVTRDLVKIQKFAIFTNVDDSYGQWDVKALKSVFQKRKPTDHVDDSYERCQWYLKALESVFRKRKPNDSGMFDCAGMLCAKHKAPVARSKGGKFDGGWEDREPERSRLEGTGENNGREDRRGKVEAKSVTIKSQNPTNLVKTAKSNISGLRIPNKKPPFRI